LVLIDKSRKNFSALINNVRFNEELRKREELNSQGEGSELDIEDW
jgi:hypothetical protein